MKIIEIWDLKIELDVDDILTIWHLRKLTPLLKKEVDHIELWIGFIKAFAIDSNIEEKINKLSVDLLLNLIEKILEVMNPLLNQIKSKDKKKL